MGSKKVGVVATMTPVTDITDRKQLDALAKRLLAFARRYARIQTWWLGEAGALAKGNTVEDVVGKVLISLFGALEPEAYSKAGKRRWDPVKYPEPWVYLMLFVKTELRNLSVSSDNQLCDRDVDDEALITTETPEALLLDALVDVDHEQRVQRLYLLLIDEMGNDADLLKLHDCIINEDIRKPKQLAERLCMSVGAINNLKKRMSSAAKRALARLEKGRTND